jgi:hypothetical protein
MSGKRLEKQTTAMNQMAEWRPPRSPYRARFGIGTKSIQIKERRRGRTRADLRTNPAVILRVDGSGDTPAGTYLW